MNKAVSRVGQDSQGNNGDEVKVLAVGCCLLYRYTTSLYVIEEVAKSTRL